MWCLVICKLEMIIHTVDLLKEYLLRNEDKANRI